MDIKPISVAEGRNSRDFSEIGFRNRYESVEEMDECKIADLLPMSAARSDGRVQHSLKRKISVAYCHARNLLIIGCQISCFLYRKTVFSCGDGGCLKCES
jgi:hypothetical protein